MNILFTCAGRRVQLLEAFYSAMAKLGVKGRLLAADTTTASAAHHKADEGLLVPPVTDESYIQVLLEMVKRHDVGLLVPLTDLDLRSIAMNRQRFEELGCTTMIGSSETINRCMDKSQMNGFLTKAGLPTIRTFSLPEFLSQPFYPCFVKPPRGSASIGSGRISNPSQLHAHVATFGEDLIVQDYVTGQEYTLDVYRTRKGEVVCVVPRQRLAVRSGEVEKALTVRSEELIQAGARLARFLGDIWGVFCCQCRRSIEQAGPVTRFFEINPRFGGGAPLSIAAGADLPLYLLQEVLGLPITARIGEFKDNLLMLRYDDAVFVTLEQSPLNLPGYQTPDFR